MKKLCLLLACLMLLSACGVIEQPVEGQTPLTTAVATTAASAMPATEAEVPTSPPASGQAEGVTYRVVLPEGAGGAVPTALSVPERWYSEVTHLLPQGGDYGTLYPYIGGYVQEYWTEARPIFGLCTADGRVVTDPYYSDVKEVSFGKDSLFWCEKWLGVDAHWNAIAAVTLSTPDGSRVEHFEAARTISGYYESYIRAAPWGWVPESPYITVRRDGLWGLIDYSLKEILPCVYPNALFFGDGLAPVLSEDGTSYSYINLKGKAILGPYAVNPDYDSYQYFAMVTDNSCPFLEVAVFSGGVAAFCENGLWGLMDITGKTLAVPGYAFISPFYRGHAVARRVYGGDKLLNLKGEEVAETTGSINPSAFGWQLEDNQRRTNIAFDGSAMSESTPQTYYYSTRDGAFIFYSETADSVDNLAMALYADGRRMGQMSYDDSYIGGGLVWNYDTQTVRILGVTPPPESPFTWRDSNLLAGAVLLELPEVDFVWPDGGLLMGRKQNYTRDYYSVTHTLYTADGTHIVGPVDMAEVFDHCIAVMDGEWGGVMDRDGNWIMRVSMLDSLPD